MPTYGPKHKNKKLGRQSRSRNSTPSGTVSGGGGGGGGGGLGGNITGQATSNSPTQGTAYLTTNLPRTCTPNDNVIESILERICGNGAAPSSACVSSIQENVKSEVIAALTVRGEACDRLMRELARRRKERIERNRERDRVERSNLLDIEAEERAQQQQQQHILQQNKQKTKLKVVPKKREREDETTAGTAIIKENLTGADVVIKCTTETGRENEKVENGSQEGKMVDTMEASEYHAPLSRDILYFGKDPSTFDDPAVYYIREVKAGMTEDDIKDIYCVAGYPANDLKELTAGELPDRDFSFAKPSNQVSAQAFANYLEPYFRNFIEEDIHFLKSRGDRVNAFMMPTLGVKSYREIWAEEDGIAYEGEENHESGAKENESRGSVEMITNEVSETDGVSLGPAMTRLLQALRPLCFEESIKDKNEGVDQVYDFVKRTLDDEVYLPATRFNESTTTTAMRMTRTKGGESSEGCNGYGGGGGSTSPRVSYAQIEERVIQELRHIGIIEETEVPDYDERWDDEVVGRLRYLQSELKRISLINGARKSRILEITRERMAYQEYMSISEDLDAQLVAAYLKRNRTLGKNKKNVKRPGCGNNYSNSGNNSYSGNSGCPGNGNNGPAGSGNNGGGNSGTAVARISVGEPIRNLMERIMKWKRIIGPAVSDISEEIPGDTLFDDATMMRLIEREKTYWNRGEQAYDSWDEESSESDNVSRSCEKQINDKVNQGAGCESTPGPGTNSSQSHLVGKSDAMDIDR